MEAGCRHEQAGHASRALAPFREAEAELPPGPDHARAMSFVGSHEQTPMEEGVALGIAALAECGDDRALRIECLLHNVVGHEITARFAEALRLAREALALLDENTDEALRISTLATVGDLEAKITPRGGRDRLRGAIALEGDRSIPDPDMSPTTCLGRALHWSDELGVARELLERSYERARSTGDEAGISAVSGYLALLECRAGALERARAYADESLAICEQGAEQDQNLGGALYPRALVAAHQGDEALARDLAGRGLSIAATIGDRAYSIHHRRVLGFLELSVGNPIAAIRHLDPLPEELAAARIRELGLHPFYPELIEALIAADRSADAASRLADWEAFGEPLRPTRRAVHGSSSPGREGSPSSARMTRCRVSSRSPAAQTPRRWPTCRRPPRRRGRCSCARSRSASAAPTARSRRACSASRPTARTGSCWATSCSAGSSATRRDFARGDLVTATVRRSCGHCIPCAQGAPDSCDTGDYLERGITRLHGFAAELVAEAPEHLVPVPRTLGRLGVLAEPASVCERALRHVRAIGGRQPWGPRRALVIGTGAIGMLATYLLRMEGLDVWAADRAPDGLKERLVAGLRRALRRHGRRTAARPRRRRRRLRRRARGRGRRADHARHAHAPAPQRRRLPARHRRAPARRVASTGASSASTRSSRTARSSAASTPTGSTGRRRSSIWTPRAPAGRRRSRRSSGCACRSTRTLTPSRTGASRRR